MMLVLAGASRISCSKPLALPSARASGLRVDMEERGDPDDIKNPVPVCAAYDGMACAGRFDTIAMYYHMAVFHD